MKKTIIAILLLPICAAVAAANGSASSIVKAENAPSASEQPKLAAAEVNYMEVYEAMFAKGTKPGKDELTGAFAGYMTTVDSPKKLMGTVFLGMSYQGEKELSGFTAAKASPKAYFKKSWTEVMKMFVPAYSEEIATFDFSGKDAVAVWDFALPITFRKTADGKLVARESDGDKAVSYRLLISKLPLGL